uniref:Elongin-B n=1 Tax=Amphiprion percula TaxID=161767 RepID=A0A3P8SUM7_AMPPE
MIRRHKTTIFTDAKESTTVYELKRIVEGILKRPPEDQRLYKDDQLLEDSKTLGDCGFTNQTARPQAPATVGLAFRINGMLCFCKLCASKYRKWFFFIVQEFPNNQCFLCFCWFSTQSCFSGWAALSQMLF